MALNHSEIQQKSQIEDPAFVLRVALQDLLAGFMDEQGQINYAALKTSPAYVAFHDQTAQLQTFDPASLITRDAKLAFWINLYNMLIMDAVISLNVKTSVAERLAGVGFFRNATYNIAGHRLSADDIEHGILRSNRGHPFFYSPQFRSDDHRLNWVIKPFEQRVHFALNCASRSCPPIRAYSAENIDDQLSMALRNFVSKDVEFISEKEMIRISSIFKWFAGDFGGREGVVDFVFANLDDQGLLGWLEANRDRVKVSFKPYDWSLNGKV